MSNCSNYVLGKTSGIDEPGSLNWGLTLCNLGAWTIVCVSVIKGVSSIGKVRHDSIWPQWEGWDMILYVMGSSSVGNMEFGSIHRGFLFIGKGFT